ncbi:soluble NSF attachment protein [Endogone sp. FLAS-F59071]|nr:soluble NSF attachment protein [Endogone sp. FLAS-F59071]|eukprot:RUS16218.1 soluble NSF attachment protein [Endogone sp. FLAS-F59071]
MLGYILVAALLVVCFKTNPNKDSFKAFITNTSSNPTTTTSKITSFLTRAITGIPAHVYNDYAFFSIVTLEDNSATFLGVLGQWLVLSELVGRTAGLRGKPAVGSRAAVDTTEMELEEMADVDRTKAKQAALKKDYLTAGNAYQAAALRFKQGFSEVSQLQAARNFEDAYRILQSAAKIYASNPQQISRAGQLYEELGKIYSSGGQRDLEKAIEAYETAANYYEVSDDFRAPAQKASAAALLAERGRYESAITLLETIVSVCAQDEIRSYKVKDYLFLEALCMIGLEDWIRLGKSVRAWDGKYQGDKWAKSRECRFIKGLIDARNLNDSQIYRDACEEYDKFNRFQEWQIALLLKGKQGIEDLR